MPYSEPNYDYDTECFLNEQREYQRYYNTPFELNGLWYTSLADYEADLHAKLDKMTIDLKLIIQQMVEKIK